jgi:hypothetical protein
MADLVAIVAAAYLETLLGVFLAVLGTFLLLFAIFSKRRVFFRVLFCLRQLPIVQDLQFHWHPGKVPDITK